jgi:hypothetical protein
MITYNTKFRRRFLCLLLLLLRQINSTFRQQAQAMDKTREDQLIIVSFIDPVTIIRKFNDSMK